MISETTAIVRSVKSLDELFASVSDEAIDQRVGRCFYIYDMNADGMAMQKSNMLMARGATTDFAEAEEQPSLEFSKIKLSYRVQAKFVLE